MSETSGLPPSNVPSQTPRRIRHRTRQNAGCGIWFLRLFILPHTLVGLGLFGWFFLNIVLLVAGTDAQGEVVRKYTTTGDEGATNHHVEYVYGLGNRYRGNSNLSSEEYAQITVPAVDKVEADPAGSPPSRLPIRYLAVGNFDYSQPLRGSWGVWGVLGFSLLFCLFWNGILSIFFYMAWIAPYVGRALYLHGKAARGRITDKRVMSGRPKRTKLKYEFETEAGQMVQGSVTAAQCSSADTDSYKGQAVTVLYKPDRPRKSVVYEYGNYEVESL